MVRLYGLLFLVNLALLVVALIDCLSTDEDEVRNLPKIAWVFIILLFSPVGAIVWFVAGRPQRAGARPGAAWRPGSGFPEATRPQRAPDDDPEFLRGLAKSRRDDEEMFSKWEADLRRREDELRRREEGEDGEGRPPLG
ncbi:PLD nuclease N-terminal domain-containing protein [Dactylosporangium sucinum]|uniref:PLD nuclease N-terminal domain-containing protein n=1 Tax=Dactylosporangium sucinum TaxID=1424081 RepID=UPI00167C4C8E|nr:PLD nuclease N-terminal domain-containing protein [Dactylosporangium sucinum]